MSSPESTKGVIQNNSVGICTLISIYWSLGTWDKILQNLFFESYWFLFSAFQNRAISCIPEVIGSSCVSMVTYIPVHVCYPIVPLRSTGMEVQNSNIIKNKLCWNLAQRVNGKKNGMSRARTGEVPTQGMTSSRKKLAREQAQNTY